MMCRLCGEPFDDGEEITARRTHVDCVGESFQPREIPEGRPSRAGQRTLTIGSEYTGPYDVLAKLRGQGRRDRPSVQRRGRIR